jgi:hypothetical protein
VEKVISELPPSAYVIFVISLAVIYAVQRLGLWQGQNAEPSSDKAVVASVIVDPAALNRASAAGEALAEALRTHTKMADDHTHMLCRRVEGLTAAVEGQKAATNALILEMARRSGK